MSSEQPSDEKKSIRSGSPVRLLWLCFGCATLMLGAIGILVPLLPTTPLVLLAAFAFSKSSPRLRLWLVEHRVFGKIIADWESNGAIAPRYKILACSAMILVLLGSVLAEISSVVILIQFVCMTAAASFILSRPNSGKDTPHSSE